MYIYIYICCFYFLLLLLFALSLLIATLHCGKLESSLVSLVLICFDYLLMNSHRH